MPRAPAWASCRSPRYRRQWGVQSEIRPVIQMSALQRETRRCSQSEGQPWPRQQVVGPRKPRQQAVGLRRQCLELVRARAAAQCASWAKPWRHKQLAALAADLADAFTAMLRKTGPPWTLALPARLRLKLPFSAGHCIVGAALVVPLALRLQSLRLVFSRLNLLPPPCQPQPCCRPRPQPQTLCAVCGFLVRVQPDQTFPPPRQRPH